MTTIIQTIRDSGQGVKVAKEAMKVIVTKTIGNKYLHYTQKFVEGISITIGGIVVSKVYNYGQPVMALFGVNGGFIGNISNNTLRFGDETFSSIVSTSKPAKDQNGIEYPKQAVIFDDKTKGYAQVYSATNEYVALLGSYTVYFDELGNPVGIFDIYNADKKENDGDREVPATVLRVILGNDVPYKIIGGKTSENDYEIKNRKYS